MLASLIESPLDFVPKDKCSDETMQRDDSSSDLLICAGKCLIYGDKKNQPLKNILFAQENPESVPVPVGLGPSWYKAAGGRPQNGVFLNLVSYIPWIKETSQGQGQSQNEGQTTENPESRIKGGEDAPPYKYKSLVNLERYESYACTSHGCGGNILNEEWLLTAAHCMPNPSPELYRVIASDHDISSNDENEQIVTVSKIIMHENWNP